MPEMTIRLRINPQTGKKDILVSLSGEEDALPHEHEQMHRKLVDKLIEGGILKAGEEGKVVVQREEDHLIPPQPAGVEPQGERKRRDRGVE